MLLRAAALSEIATLQKICLGPSRNFFQQQLKRKAQAAVWSCKDKIGLPFAPSSTGAVTSDFREGTKTSARPKYLTQASHRPSCWWPQCLRPAQAAGGTMLPPGAQLTESLCSGLAGSSIVIHLRGLGRGFFPPALPSTMPWWGADSEASGIGEHTQPVNVSFSSRNGARHTSQIG